MRIAVGSILGYFCNINAITMKNKKDKKEKFPIITFVYTIIYVIIWLILGWLYVVLLKCLPQTWSLIVCGLLATLFLMSLELFINTLKALKDPDVITASNLGMSILHYNKYKKIQAQWKSCTIGE